MKYHFVMHGKYVILLLSTIILNCGQSSDSGALGDDDIFGSDYVTNNNPTSIKNSIRLKTGSTISVDYVTKECQSLVDDSDSCKVIISYKGDKDLVDQKLDLTFGREDTHIGDVDHCPLISDSWKKCSIRITHKSGKPFHGLGKIKVKDRLFTTVAIFHVDAPKSGGVGLKQIGPAAAGEALEVINGALEGIIGDQLTDMLGISSGTGESEFEQVAQQVSQISQTVNLILNDVVQLNSFVYQSFNALTNYLAQQNKQDLILELDQIIAGSSPIFNAFENVISSSTGGCSPANYVSEETLATGSTSTGKDYISLIKSALNCVNLSCPGLEQAFYNAQSLIGTFEGTPESGFGMTNFSNALFQAISQQTVAAIKSGTEAIAAAQQNNETLMLYTFLISSELQRSYNIIHAMLYLSLYANNGKGVSGLEDLVFPVPNMSVNSNYSKNLSVLNTTYYNYAMQLGQQLADAIMTDNPGDPTVLSPVFDNAALSPKLLVSGLSTMPANQSSWINHCNIYEWTGATKAPSTSPATPAMACAPNGNPY